MTKETLKLALDYIVATNKSSQFWLIPGSNLNNVVFAIKEALAQPQERYFCSRCGKRLSKDINDVHSCTPPRDIHDDKA